MMERLLINKYTKVSGPGGRFQIGIFIIVICTTRYTDSKDSFPLCDRNA
jgi:hypothetical protein